MCDFEKKFKVWLSEVRAHTRPAFEDRVSSTPREPQAVAFSGTVGDHFTRLLSISHIHLGFTYRDNGKVPRRTTKRDKGKNHAILPAVCRSIGYHLKPSAKQIPKSS